MSGGRKPERGRADGKAFGCGAASEGRAPRELLTVELVPRTSWFRNVRSHVPAEDWERLKRDTFTRAGYRCEICGGRGPRWPVECHEVFSYDDARRVQRLEGLIALCPACHEAKHIGFAGVRGRRRAALSHLARVNGWTVADAELYVEACFEQWYQRSRHEWTLDLGLLEEYGVFVRARAVGREEGGGTRGGP